MSACTARKGRPFGGPGQAPRAEGCGLCDCVNRGGVGRSRPPSSSMSRVPGPVVCSSAFQSKQRVPVAFARRHPPTCPAPATPGCLPAQGGSGRTVPYWTRGTHPFRTVSFGVRTVGKIGCSCIVAVFAREWLATRTYSNGAGQ